jgi:deoxycytidine triphosphate deaminase
MIWNDEKIAAWASAGGVTPFDESCVNPASLDLRLGNKIREPHRCWSHLSEIDMRQHIESGDIDTMPKWDESKTFEVFWLYPKRFVLCHSLELVRIPVTVASILVLKSSQGRLGLNHSHSGWGDPGFGLPKPQTEYEKYHEEEKEGGASWTFEIQNISPWPIKLVAGQRLIQQVFFDMSDAPAIDYRYTGHYVYQTGPTVAAKSVSTP